MIRTLTQRMGRLEFHPFEIFHKAHDANVLWFWPHGSHEHPDDHSTSEDHAQTHHANSSSSTKTLSRSPSFTRAADGTMIPSKHSGRTISRSDLIQYAQQSIKKSHSKDSLLELLEEPTHAPTNDMLPIECYSDSQEENARIQWYLFYGFLLGVAVGCSIKPMLARKQ